jgi:hypothetical protein
MTLFSLAILYTCRARLSTIAFTPSLSTILACFTDPCERARRGRRSPVVHDCSLGPGVSVKLETWIPKIGRPAMLPEDVSVPYRIGSISATPHLHNPNGLAGPGSATNCKLIKPPSAGCLEGKVTPLPPPTRVSSERSI